MYVIFELWQLLDHIKCNTHSLKIGWPQTYWHFRLTGQWPSTRCSALYYTGGGTYTIYSGFVHVQLRATTTLNYHARQQAVDDVEVGVEVEHGYSFHLAWSAARPCARGLGHVPSDIRVRVLAHEGDGALARAIVGFVLLGCNDPVPAERLEVHCQGVATAPGLLAVLLAITHGALGPVLSRLVSHVHLQKRHLDTDSAQVMYCSHAFKDVD